MWCKITRLFSQRRRKEAYNRIFNSTDGRIVLEDMFYRYRVHQPTDQSNSDWAKWHDGRKSVVLDLINILDKNILEFSDSIPSKEELKEGVI